MQWPKNTKIPKITKYQNAVLGGYKWLEVKSVGIKYLYDANKHDGKG